MKTIILKSTQGIRQPELEVEVISETESSIKIKHEFFGISSVWFSKKTGIVLKNYDRKFSMYKIKGEV